MKGIQGIPPTVVQDGVFYSYDASNQVNYNAKIEKNKEKNKIYQKLSETSNKENDLEGKKFSTNMLPPYQQGVFLENTSTHFSIYSPQSFIDHTSSLSSMNNFSTYTSLSQTFSTFSAASSCLSTTPSSTNITYNSSFSHPSSYCYQNCCTPFYYQTYHQNLNHYAIVSNYNQNDCTYSFKHPCFNPEYDLLNPPHYVFALKNNDEYNSGANETDSGETSIKEEDDEKNISSTTFEAQRSDETLSNSGFSLEDKCDQITGNDKTPEFSEDHTNQAKQAEINVKIDDKSYLEAYKNEANKKQSIDGINHLEIVNDKVNEASNKNTETTFMPYIFFKDYRKQSEVEHVSKTNNNDQNEDKNNNDFEERGILNENDTDETMKVDRKSGPNNSNKKNTNRRNMVEGSNKEYKNSPVEERSVKKHHQNLLGLKTNLFFDKHIPSKNYLPYKTLNIDTSNSKISHNNIENSMNDDISSTTNLNEHSKKLEDGCRKNDTNNRKKDIKVMKNTHLNNSSVRHNSILKAIYPWMKKSHKSNNRCTKNGVANKTFNTKSSVYANKIAFCSDKKDQTPNDASEETKSHENATTENHSNQDKDEDGDDSNAETKKEDSSNDKKSSEESNNKRLRTSYSRYQTLELEKEFCFSK